MSDILKEVVYLSEEQYQELMNNGSVTVNGVTVQYSGNDQYVTPDTTLEEAKAYTDSKKEEIAQMVYDMLPVYDGAAVVE